jgi:hypothetical protein
MVRTNSANTAEWLDYPAAVLRLPARASLSVREQIEIITGSPCT